MYGPQAKIVVDIKAKVGEDNVSFSNVLSDVTITDYPTTIALLKTLKFGLLIQ